MGYSCTVAAHKTLHAIGATFATDGNPNYLTIQGKKYFFERGREQRDGAITGTLNQLIANDTLCIKAGTVRIEPDGTIKRFPKITKADLAKIATATPLVGAML